MKKYELTDETIDFCGHTLHRIKSLVDITLITGTVIAAGTLGGFVESEKNLNQDGSAWVSDNALVYGAARVYGDARVSGDARVYGDAWVCGAAWVYGDAMVSGAAWVYGDARVSGDARVFGNARVSGDARVYGAAWVKSPLQIQGTRWFFNACSSDKIRCGCQIHTYAEWHEKYRDIADDNGANDVLREYILYFNLACDLYGKEEYKIEIE